MKRLITILHRRNNDVVIHFGHYEPDKRGKLSWMGEWEEAEIPEEEFYELVKPRLESKRDEFMAQKHQERNAKKGIPQD